MNARGALYAGTAAVLFGSAYVAIVIALRSYTPLTVAAWRGLLGTMILAGLLALPAMRSLRPAAPDAAGLARLLVLGLVGGALFVIAMNSAVAATGATITAFVAGLYAVLAAVLAIPLLHERLWLREVPNSYLFKSPVNVVLASHAPEREFVARLLKQENAEVIRSWIKSPDVGYYRIEYSYQGTAGGGTKRGSFNPDFFMLLEIGDVVVVETKADDDNSPLNSGKLKYATDHFKAVNELLAKRKEKRRYYFHFVSPVDYNRFFEALRGGNIDSFVSTLQAALKP